MNKAKLTGIVLLVLALFLPGIPLHAAESRDRGLTIAPLRSQLQSTAGKMTKSTFTVVNFTQSTMKVDLSVEKFAVKNGTYEYEFGTAEDSWVKLEGSEQIELKPREERKVTYSLTVPDYAPAGGYYYALLASTEIPGSSISSELRVASLLYVSIDGDGLSTARSISDANLPVITMSPLLSYEYEVNNTGNVHFAALDYSRVQGLLTQTVSEKGMQILMPKTMKTISGSATLPLLPGIYTVEYGLKDEQGKTTAKSARVFYIPFWSIAALLVVLLVVMGIVRRRAG